MNKQSSLYNKHRPSTLEGVFGNEEVVEYLQDKTADKIAHVMLFHGPTGTGKTTFARILQPILGVADVDFEEINSANNRGIDTIRRLINICRYSPMGGGARMYVIDEAHKLTTDAQNAMLKLLEDTPASTYFILCTTDPSKLLPAIRGRCMQLGTKLLEDSTMHRLLKSIVKAEDDKLDAKVYETIIDNSDGLPRHAIQILERVLGVKKNKRLALAEQVADETGLAIDLCRVLLKNTSWKQVSTILKGLKQQGDPEGIRRIVLGYATSVLLGKDEQKAAHILEEFREPFYDVGFPGLVLACYATVKG